MLLTTEITDKDNLKIYESYRKELINQIDTLYNALQYPQKIKNIDDVETVLDCGVEYFTPQSSYYYTKLYEYWNNEDMESLLIKHFKDRIKPFNNNINTIKELYCLVKAYNFLNRKNER